MKVFEGLDVGGPSFLRNTAYFYNGIVNSGGLTAAYAAKTGAVTLGENDYVVNATSGTFTVTLPTAVGIAGKIYVIKNSGTGTVTIDPSGSETIDSASSCQLKPTNSCVTIQSNGANWIVIGVISPVHLVV